MSKTNKAAKDAAKAAEEAKKKEAKAAAEKAAKEAAVAANPPNETEMELLRQRAEEENKDNPDQAVLDAIEAKIAALPKDDEAKADPDKPLDNVGAAPPAVAPANNGKVFIDDVAGDLADYKTVLEHNLDKDLVREMNVQLDPTGRILVDNLHEASDLLRAFLDKERPKENEPHITTTWRNIIRSKEAQSQGIIGAAAVKKAEDDNEKNQIGLYNGEKYPRYSREMGHGNWDWGVTTDGTPVKVSLDPADRERLK